MTAQNEITRKEKYCYALTNTGQVLIYSIVTTYLMQFMTDTLNIASATVGIILAAARFWDAANDPIMGVFVDRTHTKWGKCRPYMLFTPIPVAIACILIFLPTGLSGTSATVYVAIMYILFTMIYTTNDIPYWGMSAVITKDPDKRVSVVAATRIIGSMGSIIIILLYMPMVKAFANATGGNTHLGYFIATVLICIAGALLMLQGFFNTKERAVDEKTDEPFFANLKLIVKEPLLLINLIAGTLNAFVMIGTLTLTTYFAKWNIWDMAVNGGNSMVNRIMSLTGGASDPIKVQSLFTPILGALPAVGMGLGIILTPMIARRFEKKQIIIWSCMAGGAVNIIFYFIGYNNLVLFILGRFLGCIPTGLWSGLTTSMFGDCVDYLEWKTGKRKEGACFSLLTFVSKFANGIGALLAGSILSMMSYKEGLDNTFDELNKLLAAAATDAEKNRIIEQMLGTSQPAEALRGIFMICTLIMGIGMILCAIPYFFYKLDRNTHVKILRELKERGEGSADIIMTTDYVAVDDGY